MQTDVSKIVSISLKVNKWYWIITWGENYNHKNLNTNALLISVNRSAVSSNLLIKDNVIAAFLYRSDLKKLLESR